MIDLSLIAVLDPEVVAQLVVRRGRVPLDSLTAREREVLSLMAEGRSNGAIAKALVVTDGAVDYQTTTNDGKTLRTTRLDCGKSRRSRCQH